MPMSFSGRSRQMSNPFQQQTQYAPPPENPMLKQLMERIGQLEQMIRQQSQGGGGQQQPAQGGGGQRPSAPSLQGAAAPTAPQQGGGSQTRAQFIDQTYRQFLGRPASPEEMAGYTAFDPQQIVAVVSRSQEAQNAARTGKNAYGEPFGPWGTGGIPTSTTGVQPPQARQPGMPLIGAGQTLTPQQAELYRTGASNATLRANGVAGRYLLEREDPTAPLAPEAIARNVIADRASGFTGTRDEAGNVRSGFYGDTVRQQAPPPPPEVGRVTPIIEGPPPPIEDDEDRN